MHALEGDEEVKLEAEETMAERIKLNPQKSKNTGTGLKIYLLAQIIAGNNSYRLKNKIRHILYLLYQHNKITKKFTAI